MTPSSDRGSCLSTRYRHLAIKGTVFLLIVDTRWRPSGSNNGRQLRNLRQDGVLPLPAFFCKSAICDDMADFRFYQRKAYFSSPPFWKMDSLPVRRHLEMTAYPHYVAIPTCRHLENLASIPVSRHVGETAASIGSHLRQHDVALPRSHFERMASLPFNRQMAR